jgi:hypothetical protein
MVDGKVLYASDLGLNLFSRHGGTESGLVDELSTQLSRRSLGTLQARYFSQNS